MNNNGNNGNNGSNALELVNLTKSFKSINAVTNLSLSVPHGSVYGFLGRNGAGKTTTLKMITGLSKPTSGEIFIYGEKVEFGTTHSFKNIGFLPDVPEYYSFMTAEEYLFLCGRLHRMADSEIKKRIAEIFDIIYLDKKRLKTKVSTFSRGMKQKLGIGASLLHSPSLILLDEPTSALDPIGRKETIDIIQSLKGKYTVIFSTHILNDIERVCDRIAVIEKGSLVLDGGINELSGKTASNIARVTVSSDGDEDKNADIFGVFISELENTGFAKDISSETDGNTLMLVFNTSERQKAGVEIPKIIAKHGLSLSRFSFDELKLEDIFISATSDKQNKV